jgi:hypothetical protein
MFRHAAVRSQYKLADFAVNLASEGFDRSAQLVTLTFSRAGLDVKSRPDCGDSTIALFGRYR